jgi:F5/8 type C domain/Bacterial TSP3 repeat
MTRWTRLSAFTPAVARRPLSYLTSLASYSVGLWAFGLVYLLLSSMASAAPVTLAWDAVSDPSLAGYKLYYGYASGQYSFNVNVGNTTTASLSGLDQSKVYYVAVTAYDTAGNESDFSNEVTYDLSKIDTDGDGLSDWDEITVYKTDPNRADTDGDGVKDGAEVKQKTDPKNAASFLPQNLPEVPRWQMKVVSVDSEQLSGGDWLAENAIDGDPDTFWHTEWNPTSPTPPHEIVISLGANYSVGGFTYMPRQDGSLIGTVAKYSFYVSVDGVNWGDPVFSGTFGKNANKKRVLFAGRAGQFVRFVAKSEVNGNPWTNAAEIRVLGTPVAVPALIKVPQSQMSIVFVDSEQLSGGDWRAENAIDGDTNTFWHTEWNPTSPEHPHKLDIALGGTYEVWKLRYLPRQDGDLTGTVSRYSIYVSMDGVKWGNAVATGTLTKDAAEKVLVFLGKTGRFVRFVAQSEVNGNPWTSAAEINILGVPK